MLGAPLVATMASRAETNTTVTEVAPAGPVLPCSPPQVEQVNGTTYYQCGQSYYVVAYGNAGPTYMPASPPHALT